MSNVFNMEPRAQQEWAWLLAIWLFLGGTGGGLFLLFLAFALPAYFGVLSLVLIMSGGVVLLLELGNPLRAWRTMFRPTTSWLSRGVLFVLLFVISSVFSVGPRFEKLSWLSSLDNQLSEQVFGWVAGFCALMIILYPAFFFLSTSRAIPFWRSPLLPVLFVGYALLGAVGVVLLLAPDTGALSELASFAVVLILINAAMIAIYLATMLRSGGSARQSVRLLSSVPLGYMFWLGVVAAGLVLPLLQILLLPPSTATAGFLLLLGGLLFRYCLLRAGVYVPPALVAAAFDFSKLNRTSAQFQREYAGMDAQRASRLA